MLDRATYTELEVLREQIAVLEYELHLLRETADTEVVALMTNADLSPGQARLLQALSCGRPKERATLAAICCRDENDNLRNIDSMVKHVRRKHPDLTINSLYGIGYQLPPESVATVTRWKTGGKHENQPGRN